MSPMYVILGLLALAFIVSAPFLKTYLTRKAMGISAIDGKALYENVPARDLEELGTPLVFSAGLLTASSLVDEVVASKKRYFARSQSEYSLRYIAPDDVKIRLVADGAVTVLQVEEFRGYVGSPQGMYEWRDMRKALSKLATERSVQTGPGPVRTFEKTHKLEDGNWVWRASA